MDLQDRIDNVQRRASDLLPRTQRAQKREAAAAEAEREGWHSLEDVMAEATAIITAKRDAAA